MDDAFSKSVMLACAAIALVIFITGSFAVFKNNQESLAKLNSKAFEQMEQEFD